VGKSLIVDLQDESATIALGAEIAAALPQIYRGWSILLQGELGAGKSTLARALLHALGYEGRVPSPTYTLVEPYRFSRGDIYHIDLYRVADVNELEFMGWSDFQTGLKLIEWPERVPFLSDEADLKVALKYVGSGRTGDLCALSARGDAMLQRIGVAIPGSVRS
jgi:tRNA threonylcarbamoyladenosine biosynthesis protein TsaE